MIAKRVPPSSVMVLTRNAPGGTSPWSVPPVATFAVGLQLVGQNGFRAPESRLNDDLFLGAMGAGSSAGLFFSAIGAGFSSAASKAGDTRFDIQMSEKNLFIVFRRPWSQRWRPAEIAAVRAGRECSVW